MKKPILLVLFCALLGVVVFLSSCEQEDQAVENREKVAISIPEGFVLDSLFCPSDHDMGTWVSLAEGPDDIMYACDQFGALYTFPKPAVGEVIDSNSVDSVPLDIGYAHGLLWAHNSLYVAVNRRWQDTIAYGSGVYRLADTDEDGTLDQSELLLKLEGNGEHGPHSFITSPDGQEIYFIAGNHTLIPDEIAANSLLPDYWGEDNLLQPYLDARGHATEVEAPGGWIAKTDPEGKQWQLISAGYRNAFDIGFNEAGELFAFDADMEWDFGMPWYRPIRICHATSGSEFGWRTGTGKWPVYYPDALPPVVDLGQGSPTAVVMGKDLDLPSRFKNGLFAADWSFGTMYYIDLRPEGSTYTATREEFFSGVPLPLTDAIASQEGDLFFATGGRDLESHLYRLRYTGGSSESVPDYDTPDTKNLRSIRHQLEEEHRTPTSAGVNLAWEYLDHDDRFIRYAARVALEHHDPSSWIKKFFTEANPTKLIQAGLAIARAGKASEQQSILQKLGSIEWDDLSASERTDLLRAYELVLIRMGMPSSGQRSGLIERIRKVFPSGDLALDREASEILVYLDDPLIVTDAIAKMVEHTEAGTTRETAMLSDEISSRHEDYGKVVKEVIANMPPAEAIHYAVLLSHAEEGWTPDLRETYFQWFYDVMSAKGGMSFKAFMENIRVSALEKIPEQEREHYRELSGVFSPVAEMANLPQPEGPGKAYNMYHINRALRDHLKNDYQGTIEDGKRMFEAALCSSCHRMRGEGGISGPDLTQLHTRFDQGDMVNAIFSPNDAISDQYAFTLFTLEDGTKRAGRVFSEDDEKVVIMPNPYTSTVKEEIPASTIVERGPSPVSPMPPGLLNRLNVQEIADLFAYLLSGGDEEWFYYGGEKGLEEDAAD